MIKNIHEFRATKTRMTFEQYLDKCGAEPDGEGPYEVYAGSLYIQANDKAGGVCQLVLGNEIHTGPLFDLENILWDFAKWELRVPLNEIEADMHARSREFLFAIGQQCSLDEVNPDYLNIGSRKAWQYLTDQWNEFYAKEDEKPTHQLRVCWECPDGWDTCDISDVIQIREFRRIHQRPFDIITLYQNNEDGTQDAIYDIEPGEIKHIEFAAKLCGLK